MLARADGRPGHIFNLGHGVLPETDPAPDATRRARPRADRGGRRRMTRPAVVLMAYGSPDRLADVPAYYADIRGGRPVRPELLDDLVARYRALGIDDSDGPSPLNAITEETRAALEDAARTSASSPACATGSRGSRARSTRRSSSGTTRSSASCSRPTGRRSRSRSTSSSSTRPSPGASRPGSSGSGERSPGSSRCWRSAFALHLESRRARRLHRALAAGAHPRDAATRTAESLLETSRLVADAAGVGDWSFAFQSESPTGEPWLGPDILDHLDALAAAGVTEVLVCPVGFVSDHLEIRWDLDVEAADRARRARARLRADRDAERRPGADRRARRDRAARARGRGRVGR